MEWDPACHSPVRCHNRDRTRSGIGGHDGVDAQIKVVLGAIGKFGGGAVEKDSRRSGEIRADQSDS